MKIKECPFCECSVFPTMSVHHGYMTLKCINKNCGVIVDVPCNESGEAIERFNNRKRELNPTIINDEEFTVLWLFMRFFTHTHKRENFKVYNSDTGMLVCDHFEESDSDEYDNWFVNHFRIKETDDEYIVIIHARERK